MPSIWIQVSDTNGINVGAKFKIKSELDDVDDLCEAIKVKLDPKLKYCAAAELSVYPAATAFENYNAITAFRRSAPPPVGTSEEAPLVVIAPADPRATAAAIKKDSNKILIELLKNVKKTMDKQTEVLGGIGEVLEEIGDKDCYDRISESSKPRKLSKSDYENTFNVPVTDLKCMITGICLTKLLAAAPTKPKNLEDAPTSPKSWNPVTLSHLLPRSTNAKERLSLGYAKADIENIRNSLLLCKGIEEAFDHKFLSFVPTDKPFSDNRYKLHIWVESIKLDPIYEGATQTIGDFNDAPLILSVNSSATHNPFKRALSYQAFRAFKMYGKRFGLTELPEDSDTSVYQGAYKQMRLAYAQQLAKDAAADAEDDEEQDEAMDEESSVEDI